MIKKNKPITVLLLLAVVCIYGTILYRSFSQNPLVENQVSESLAFGNEMTMSYLKDSFKIDFYLKDPFKSGQSMKVENKDFSQSIARTSAAKGLTAEKKDVKPIKWPEIKYYGFVKNQKKNQGLSLISIDGQLVKLANGQVHQEVKFLYSNLDSAKFNYKGLTKMIGK